ncbi:MAG: hypothetical protein U5L95_02520 [Candidatus Saccharibacteria bacterium]|nr:hypothetical protein [Candidatus Saccharibacteria bacterium]
MLEKTGTLLEEFQTVEVGAPRKSDMHNHSFVGIIVKDGILESRGTVIVEDQCGEAFEVDADNVEVRED